MSKLVIFLQTDVFIRKNHTSTRLVEQIHLSQAKPFTIFATKFKINK